MNLRETLHRLWITWQTGQREKLWQVPIIKLSKYVRLAVYVFPYIVIKSIIFVFWCWSLPYMWYSNVTKKVGISEIVIMLGLINGGLAFFGVVLSPINELLQDISLWYIKYFLIYMSWSGLTFASTLILAFIMIMNYKTKIWEEKLEKQKQKNEDGEFHHLRIKQIERWEESEKASEEKLEQYGGNN